MPNSTNITDINAAHFIKVIVCNEFGISMQAIESVNQFDYITWPRHIATWLCCKSCGWSLYQAGRIFGKGHTTIAHSVKVVNTRILFCSEDQFQVNKICDDLDHLIKKLHPAYHSLGCSTQ